jgi:hypothetical protein
VFGRPSFFQLVNLCIIIVARDPSCRLVYLTSTFQPPRSNSPSLIHLIQTAHMRISHVPVLQEKIHHAAVEPALETYTDGFLEEDLLKDTVKITRTPISSQTSKLTNRTAARPRKMFSRLKIAAIRHPPGCQGSRWFNRVLMRPLMCPRTL